MDFKEVPSTRGNGKFQKWLVKWEGHQEWTWETRKQFCAPRVRPLAGLQCQAWHSGPIVTSCPPPPP